MVCYCYCCNFFNDILLNFDGRLCADLVYLSAYVMQLLINEIDLELLNGWLSKQ